MGGEVVEGGGAGAVAFYFVVEVGGAGREVVDEERDELLAGAGLEGVVGAAFAADGGVGFGAHLAAAERACAVGGVEDGGVGEGEELGVEAVVEERGELGGGLVGERSGRPTSPMKRVSPVKTARGWCVMGSRATRLTPSSVWPGVARTRRLVWPRGMESPSWSGWCG